MLDAQVELVHTYHPNGAGLHFSGGTIGMAPIIRALADGGRDDVLWEALQKDDEPSYGYFMASTPANPGGMPPFGEQRDLGNSKNHMILAQIEEWFHTGLAGIRPAADATTYDRLIFQPTQVGDLCHVEGSYRTPHGVAATSWTSSQRRFELTVTVPANTTAEVRVPTEGLRVVRAPCGATLERVEGNDTIYSVPAGKFSFLAVGRGVRGGA